MKHRKTHIISGIVLICLTLVFLSLIFIVAPKVDKARNKVVPHKAYTVSKRAHALHDQLFIADLHNDVLLWRRYPGREHDYGHSDLPRLKAGGVNLQTFSVVTKSPSGQNFAQNARSTPDNITRLAIGQLWPPQTWGSLKERALFQAWRLQKLANMRRYNLVIIRNQADLRQLKEDQIGAILAIEGAHALEGRLENIDHLYKAGYRMIGLQHFFDNDLGGSLHGTDKSGLTDFGRAVVKELSHRDIMIDVAHSSKAVVRDVLTLTDDPILISHGGIYGNCQKTRHRNLPDDLLKEIAQRGGIIGIGFFSPALCDPSLKGIAQTITETVRLLGEDAVALGSDFDGSVTTHLDASEFSALTQALMDQGLEDKIIAKIMGENVRRFMAQTLPE